MTGTAGTTLVLLGIASFILPLFGLQFKILNLLGGWQWLASIIAILLGLVMVSRDKR